MQRLILAVLVFILSGCAMGEEIKRIQETKEAQNQRDMSRSTNLTGEQLFIRSCNTCHPGGKAGFGPTLENLSKDFPEDDALRTFLRAGKGTMPALPKASVNDQEMDSLIKYLRFLTSESQ